HNLNIVFTDDVKGKISVSLQDVNLGTAMDAILKVNGYDWFIMENIVVVKPSDLEIEGEFITRVYKLNYVDAAAVATALQNVLTAKGRVQVFSPVMKGGLVGQGSGVGQGGGTQGSGTGAAGLLGGIGGGGGQQQQTSGAQSGRGGGGQSAPSMDHLLVTDTYSNFNKIEKIIAYLDLQIPQVNIAVKFIETKLSANERLGIDWTGRSSLSIPAGTEGDETNILNIGHWESMRIATLTRPIFTALLDILSSDGNTRLLQEPQVTVKENVLAELTVGTSIPILVPQPEGGLAGTQPFQFQDEEINITLSVLPRINENKYISMEVNAVVQALVGYTTQGERPIISTRSTQTSVMVKNGETLLMGGLIFEQLIETSSTFPILGKIPLIKYLFNHKSTQTEQRELLLFITPNIIKLS
ncbi:MAG: type II and III secretion system protein, partial [Candidatus Neomarinimicrobiota bacterium]